MEESRFFDEYFDFLMEKSHLDKRYCRNLSNMLQILLKSEFFWCLDRDQNRAEDGLELRRTFVEDAGLDLEKAEEEPCSVLEMLIALAIRVDLHIIGIPSEGSRPDILLKMWFENLGLHEFDNEMLRKIGYDRFADGIFEILEVWLSRNFEKNGEGSPFLVLYDARDQRDREIWDQVNSFAYEYWRKMGH